VDNSKCGLEIPHLKVTLSRFLEFKDKDGIRQNKSDCVMQKNYEGVKAKHEALGEKARKLEFIFKDTDGDLEPTCNGNLIKCTYNLDCSAPFDAICGCCGNTPYVFFRFMILRNVKVPVTVFSAPPLGYGQVKEPAGWAPKVFDMKVLNVEQGKYEKKG